MEMNARGGFLQRICSRPSVVGHAILVPWIRPLLLVLLITYFVLAIVTMDGGHAWGDDWAQYILHARNLLTGAPYGETGYIFNPDNPSVGPSTYPPGVPFLL